MRYDDIARKIREETRIMESSVARMNALADELESAEKAIADELERIENAIPKLDKVPEYDQSKYFPSKMLISVPEAADILGLSKTTVYTLIHRDDFPVVRLGGRTLINVRKLQEWVDGQTGSNL